jgi:hypothetical protein
MTDSGEFGASSSAGVPADGTVTITWLFAFPLAAMSRARFTALKYGLWTSTVPCGVTKSR